MSEYHSGAYFVRRGGGRHGGAKRAAGVLIAVLMLLTAIICCLVYFLPRLTQSVGVGGSAFIGKKFYFLALGKYEARDDALIAAQDAQNRGGAGYIYNDGAYNVIASVYDSESDAKALSSVNDNSYYFEVVVSKHNTESADDISAVEYLLSDWFNAMRTAADELQRGTATEAQAESIAQKACFTLGVFAEKASLPELRVALRLLSEYACPQSISVLAYIRYVHVRAIAVISQMLN